MSEDALDRVSGGRKTFSKAEKRDYAIQKQEQETKSVLNDPVKVSETSQKFREHIKRERKRLGLS